METADHVSLIVFPLPQNIEGAIEGIALRINVRTLFESIVDTIAKCLKFIPPLLHPVLEDKPPPLNLI